MLGTVPVLACRFCLKVHSTSVALMASLTCQGWPSLGETCRCIRNIVRSMEQTLPVEASCSLKKKNPQCNMLVSLPVAEPNAAQSIKQTKPLIDNLLVETQVLLINYKNSCISALFNNSPCSILDFCLDLLNVRCHRLFSDATTTVLVTLSENAMPKRFHPVIIIIAAATTTHTSITSSKIRWCCRDYRSIAKGWICWWSF